MVRYTELFEMLSNTLFTRISLWLDFQTRNESRNEDIAEIITIFNVFRNQIKHDFLVYDMDSQKNPSDL